MEKDLISITEMAKWQNVTTETLRHYDRIGIFKPVFKDENGTRYYSVLQYERLGTIRDLVATGIKLNEINDYLNNRTLENSKKLLLTQEKRLSEQIETLEAKRTAVQNQISALEAVSHAAYPEEARIKAYPQRRFLMSLGLVYNDSSLTRADHELEIGLREIEQTSRASVYATNGFGAIFPYGCDTECHVAFELDENSKLDQLRNPNLKAGVLPAGKYLCASHVGTLWEVGKGMNKIARYLLEHKIQPKSEWVVDCVVVDYTVTDKDEERLYELQMLVEED